MEQWHYDNLSKQISEIDKKYDDKMDRILEQVTKTNGRVNTQESFVKQLFRDVELLKTNKSENRGRDKTIWWVFLAAVAVAWFFIQQAININQRTEKVQNQTTIQK